MLENIKIAIETINEERESGTKFVFMENVRSHAVKNALLYMCANKIEEAQAVALLDYTILKTGEEGCLISEDGMYFNRLRNKIDLKCLKNAAVSKKNLIFTMENGESISIAAGRFAERIADVANEIVRLRDGGKPKEKKKKDELENGPDVVIVQKPKNNPFSFKL